MAARVLALSSSRVGNSGYLQEAVPHIHKFLGDQPLKIAFIPFAGVATSEADYLQMVQQGLRSLPYRVQVVNASNGSSLIDESDAIMIGGGNTFKLLRDLYDTKLLDLIQRKVAGGTPYVGWSAGANITGLTISTTNDMPIVEPESFKALSFFPFQLNPHYINLVMEGHNGETRDQRLTEFVIMNPTVPVVCLPEGTAIQLADGIATYVGIQEGVIFTNDNGKVNRQPMPVGSDLSYLLK